MSRARSQFRCIIWTENRSAFRCSGRLPGSAFAAASRAFVGLALAGGKPDPFPVLAAINSGRGLPGFDGSDRSACSSRRIFPGYAFSGHGLFKGILKCAARKPLVLIGQNCIRLCIRFDRCRWRASGKDCGKRQNRQPVGCLSKFPTDHALSPLQLLPAAINGFPFLRSRQRLAPWLAVSPELGSLWCQRHTGIWRSRRLCGT